MTGLEQFTADYLPALKQAVDKHPDEYQWPAGVTAEAVAARMVTRISTASIGAVNINSHSFKTLAKQYGIKNTYKAWREFLGQSYGVAKVAP